MQAHNAEVEGSSPSHQRLTLRLLLDLDQPGKGGEIESAWNEEIRARVKAVPWVAGLWNDNLATASSL
jgi:hypothetical protein